MSERLPAIAALPTALSALRDKYAEMERLRRAHALGLEGEPAATKASMRALAARFPGALREIDRIPFTEIEVRMAALDVVMTTAAADVPDWALWSVSYHGTMRAVLRIKRLSSRDSDAAEVLGLVCEGYAAADDEPPREWFDLETLEQLLRPPRRRASLWVLAEVARSYGVTVERVERALFFF